MASEKWTNFWKFSRGLPYEVIKTYYWNKVYKKLLNDFNLKKPQVLELGGGVGTLSLKMAEEYNAEITIVDSLDECENRARRKFREKDKELEFITEDILDFKTDKKFDIVHSEGLVEHFIGNNRLKAVKKHLEPLNKKGIALIIAPVNSILYPLRIISFRLIEPEIYEEPFSLKELRQFVSQIGKHEITKEFKNLFDVGVRIEKTA